MSLDKYCLNGSQFSDPPSPTNQFRGSSRSWLTSQNRANSNSNRLTRTFKYQLSTSQFLSPLESQIEPTFSDLTNQTNFHCNLYDEKDILLDLLHALSGREGVLLRYDLKFDKKNILESLKGPQFTPLPEVIDISVKELLFEILPTCSQVYAILKFINEFSKFDYGFVNHRLCSAIRGQVQDYLQEVNHHLINMDNLTINHLNVSLYKPRQIINIIYTLVQDIAHAATQITLSNSSNPVQSEAMDNVEDFLESLKKGFDMDEILSGNVLLRKPIGHEIFSIIEHRMEIDQGNPENYNLLQTLYETCSKPYLNILYHWIWNGEIVDPWGEFMIGNTKSITRDVLDKDFTGEYWAHIYYLREDKVPKPLQHLKQKILLSGKYWFVQKSCFKKDITDSSLTFSDTRLGHNVELAYLQANKSLQNMLIKDHNLASSLKSIKNYFLFGSGDLLTQFIDVAQAELIKSKKYVSVEKLQSLLEITLRQTGSNLNPDRDMNRLIVSLNDRSFFDWMLMILSVNGMPDSRVENISQTDPKAALQPPANDGSQNRELNGFESVQLEFHVDFPVSLVISRSVLTRYQIISRYLMTIKNAQRALTACWTLHSKAKTAIWKVSTPLKNRIMVLRKRMSDFYSNLLYYVNFHVLSKRWDLFMESLDSPSTTVDKLIHGHIDFLDMCIKECFLTNSKLLRTQSKIYATCLSFANQQYLFQRILFQHEQSEKHQQNYEKMVHRLGRFEHHFEHNLKVFREACSIFASTDTYNVISVFF